MTEQQPSKAIVTITEMARMCGLSRARFYQLIDEGVFPQPSRNEQTKRPFYDQDQQQQCLLVRRTNRGTNGKAIIFYGLRVEVPAATKKARNPKKNAKKVIPAGQQDNRIVELRHGLHQLGMVNVTDTDIRRALTQVFPDGWNDVESGDALRAVFAQLRIKKQA